MAKKKLSGDTEKKETTRQFLGRIENTRGDRISLTDSKSFNRFLGRGRAVRHMPLPSLSDRDGDFD